jgi:fatty acid desaturase
MTTTDTTDAKPAETSGDGAWARHFTREELDELLAMQDWRSWGTLLLNWGIIFASMAMVAAWPNPLTVVAALFLIGGRQLGMSIIMHDASHRSYLSNARLNDWVANWLAAYPVWTDLLPYRPYHMQHHARTWTKGDPDLDLATPFPITRQSLARKIWRDLSGQTGWKRFKATLRRDLSISNGKSARKDGGRSGTTALQGVVLTNLLILGLLTVAGHPALYLLWVGAWFTTYSLAMRIRAIAEHSMPTDRDDPLGHTRTTIARWWERLLFAPNFVNYHLEHHLLMKVPHYNLPRMHRMLAEKGLLERANVVVGYPAVLRLASSRPA